MKTKVWDVHMEKLAEETQLELRGRGIQVSASELRTALLAVAPRTFDVVPDPRDRSIRPGIQIDEILEIVR